MAYIFRGGKKNLHIYHSVDIRWGDCSQIHTELLLFEEAYKNGPYQYYHLLTGVDLPIKPIDEILKFFDTHKGKEFVGFVGPEQQQKVMRYHFLMRHAKRTSENFIVWFFIRVFRKILEFVANSLFKRSNDGMLFVLGHVYVSLTNDACSYILANKSYIKKRFKHTLCADEFFIQTLLWNSPFKDKLWDTHNYKNDKWITTSLNRAINAENNNEGSKREIDWNRGKPYTWGQSPDDFEILKNSNQLFARKFDESLSEWLMPKIVQLVNGNNDKVKNMNRKILSIIIPTYNMEKYLRRCLDSLLVDEDLEMLEIWVVNDGSKDGSSAIAHEYADKYPMAFNVIDKDNGNYGSCINAALSQCTGAYVKILDSDDYFDTQELSKLIKRLKLTTADAILLDYTEVIQEKRKVVSLDYGDNQVINLTNECPKYFGMHSVAYKTNIFKKFDYHQTEGISYTDQEWIFYPMFYVESIQFMQINLYRYVLAREGQTVTPASFQKNIPSLMRLVTTMLEEIMRKKNLSYGHKCYAENVLQAQLFLIYVVNLVTLDKKDSYISELKEMDNLVASYDKEFYGKLNERSIKSLFPYIRLFRKGIVLPNSIRSVIRWFITFYHKMNNKSTVYDA